MSRMLRIEYPAAIHCVMSWVDWGEKIFRGDVDRHDLLLTPGAVGDDRHGGIDCQAVTLGDAAECGNTTAGSEDDARTALVLNGQCYGLITI